MDLRAHAIDLAESGYFVVPAHVSRTMEGKKVVRYPVVDEVAWSVKDAESDPSKVAAMPWDEANTITLNLDYSGVMAFDLDVAINEVEIDIGNGRVEIVEDKIKGGALLEKFSQDFGIDTQVAARSQSGVGRHVFFSRPQGLRSSVKELGDYVDVKATGALFLGDPGMLPEKHLLPRLDPTHLRRYPALKEKERTRPLTKPSAPKFLKGESGTPYGLKALDAEMKSLEQEWIKGSGNRNNAVNATSFAVGQLVAGGELHETDSYVRIQEFLRSVGGERHSKTLDSGFYAGMLDPRSSDSVDQSDPVETQKVSENRVEALRAQLKTPAEMRTLPAPEWLIEGWLVKSGLAHIIGEGKIGKTFIALDMAASLASSLTWPDHVEHAEQYSVLYIAGEGAYGLGQRIAAWEETFGPMGNIKFLPRPIHVMQKEGRNLRQSDEWRTMASIIKEDRFDLILLDTQQRMTVGVAENDATEMGQLVDALEEITRETDACLALLHHVNKGETASARGSSVLAGSVNTEIKLTGDRSEGLIRVANTLQKDGPMADPLYFKLTEAADSVVPVQIEAPDEEEETEGQPSKKSTRDIQWEDRRMRVMNRFERYPGEPLTLEELHNATAIPKSTLSKMLTALVEKGTLRKNQDQTWSQP